MKRSHVVILALRTDLASARSSSRGWATAEGRSTHRLAFGIHLRSRISMKLSLVALRAAMRHTHHVMSSVCTYGSCLVSLRMSTPCQRATLRKLTSTRQCEKSSRVQKCYASCTPNLVHDVANELDETRGGDSDAVRRRVLLACHGDAYSFKEDHGDTNNLEPPGVASRPAFKERRWLAQQFCPFIYQALSTWLVQASPTSVTFQV